MLTALYRHFDADGVLLYVGISLSPVYRLASHMHGSAWVANITRVSIEWFKTRREALDAESKAIIEENPEHNIAGKAGRSNPSVIPPAKPREPRYVDRPEHVAAHLNLSLRAIVKAIKGGMPREQIGPRRFRYELGAVEDWGRANAERKVEREIASRIEDARASQEAVHAAVQAAWARQVNKQK